MLSNTHYPLTWGSLDGVEPLISSQEEYSDTFLGQLTAINTNHWTGGDQIVYDEIGNPVHYRGIDLTWENGRELTSAIGSGIYAEYTYDSNGLRTSKKLDDYFVHTYKYINGKVCYEEYEDKKFWFFYDADGNPSHFRYFHDENEYDDYYYGCNWRGDVIAIFDSEGNLAGSYDYDAWGNAISFNDADGNYTNDSTHITLINPIRYRGYYCDMETGFYYLNSRYYDPYNHRFLNADSEEVATATPNALTDKNLYLYCDNNPINRADNGGTFWHIVAGAAIGGLIGGISSIVGQSVGGQKINWAEVGVSAASGVLTGVITTVCPGMGAVATGIVHGVVGAGTHAAIEVVNGRTPTVKGTLVAGVTSGVLAGGTKAVANLVNKGFKIQKIGRLEASNHANDPQLGIKYKINKPNGRSTTRSFEFHYNHYHKGYKPHWQRNSWNIFNNSVSSLKHWTWWGKRI